MKQDTDGGAFNIHDSSYVTFLGDLVLEHIEVEGSGGGMYITNDVSERFGGCFALLVIVFSMLKKATSTPACPHFFLLSPPGWCSVRVSHSAPTAHTARALQ